MLVDPWIITLFVLYAVSAVLLLVALYTGFTINRHWQPDTYTAGQLHLEHRNLLASVVLQFMLLLQLFILLTFIYVVNIHLPQVVAGAMCAQGILQLNPLGMPALLLKWVGLIIYFTMWATNFLDQREPRNPLTPGKYRLLPLVTLLFVADAVLTIYFFSGVRADVVATCCSMDFSYSALPEAGGSATDGRLWAVGYLIWAALQLGAVLRFRDRNRVWLPPGALVTGLLFIPAMRHYFVRFIYEMPAHHCLFDIFWGEYYYAGYLLFGGLTLYAAAVLFLAVLQISAPKLHESTTKPGLRAKQSAVAGLGLIIVLPVFYWLKWYL